MIKIEKVNKYFYRHKKKEIHVINNTSVNLEEKGLVSLLGPSGCGKTTLLNAIGGLDRINSGKILIDGKKISSRFYRKVDKIRNLNIGYIFQDYNLLDDKTVFENVAISLRINGIKNKEEIKKRVTYILEKVGMYKYRNRLASMLSGGERQRVGIARAIVKNPKIIIADEPTGNLDSRNTIEVMNIIKAISKTKLVILVTHERELAEFYSDRILEIEDGKIINDRVNEHNDELDYKMDSKIYLKDFKNHDTLKKDHINVDYYSDSKEKINVKIVVVNGSIYIDTGNNNKTEIVDENKIELIDDHYKKISKEDAEKYEFDMNSVSNTKYKYKYSSILGPITLLIEGFRKVRDYSFIKKLLLIGFFASGMFITYSVSSYFGIQRIDDSKFVEYNKNYLIVEMEKVKIDKYIALEKDEDINYVIPSNSMVTMRLSFDKYYQTKDYAAQVKASLVSIDMLKDEDIIYGRNIENRDEIVVDLATFKNMKKLEEIEQTGIFKAEDLLGYKLYADGSFPYTIVGISNTNMASLYVQEQELLNIIFLAKEDVWGVEPVYDYELIDYELIKDKIHLKKGRFPTNDYETIVHYDYKDEYKINKTISHKVNNKKLKVVGYYTSDVFKTPLLVNRNTMKYRTILSKANIMIYAKDKQTIIDKYKENYNIKDSYDYSKAKYIKAKQKATKNVIKTSAVFLAISLIEIYLMVRSSFLSRIKEVGIYRAIGVKKKDIYKMFTGEIITITTLASIPGIALMSYILKELSFIESINDMFQVDKKVIIITIVGIYAFNLFVGLLPVYRTIRKTPAQILSRTDIQ